MAHARHPDVALVHGVGDEIEHASLVADGQALILFVVCRVEVEEGCRKEKIRDTGEKKDRRSTAPQLLNARRESALAKPGDFFPAVTELMSDVATVCTQKRRGSVSREERRKMEADKSTQGLNGLESGGLVRKATTHCS